MTFYKSTTLDKILPKERGISVKINLTDYIPAGYQGLPLLNSNIKLVPGDAVVIPLKKMVYEAIVMEEAKEAE